MSFIVRNVNDYHSPSRFSHIDYKNIKPNVLYIKKVILWDINYCSNFGKKIIIP